MKAYRRNQKILLGKAETSLLKAFVILFVVITDLLNEVLPGAHASGGRTSL